MKKVLLLTVMCVLGLFGVRAQETSFFYDFNEGSLDGWRVFQEEGATSPNWAIGGDDWIEENCIERLICEQERENSDLVVGNYHRFSIYDKRQNRSGGPYCISFIYPDSYYFGKTYRGIQ